MATIARGYITIAAINDGAAGSPAVTVVLVPQTENGVVIKNESNEVVLMALVYVGGVEYGRIPSSRYVWTRTSSDTASDATWNSGHSGVGDTITIPADDFDGSSAYYECAITYDTDADTDEGDIVLDFTTGELYVTSVVPKTITLDETTGALVASDTAATSVSMDGESGIVSSS